MSKFILTSTNRSIAAQIASLLNLGGQLLYGQTEWSILANPITYVLELYGEQVAGVIGLEVKTPQITEMKHLCVHPGYRNRGIGLKLLKKGIEYATTEFVYGAVRSDNAVNIRNNLRIGMKPVAKHRSRSREIIIFAGRRTSLSHGTNARDSKRDQVRSSHG